MIADYLCYLAFYIYDCSYFTYRAFQYGGLLFLHNSLLNILYLDYYFTIYYETIFICNITT